MTSLRRSKSPTPLDCIIVGGGASGLAAAADLSRRGLWPIELGAEFVHGEPESTFGVARQAGLRLVEIADDEPRARGRSDFFELIDKVMGRLDPKAPDRPFGDFVAELPHSLRRAGLLAASYVQSFHAADLSLISCADLAEQQKSVGQERANFRLVDGYDGLIDALKDGVPASSILTGVVVEEIDWSGRLVRVRARRGGFSAKTVLVTCPSASSSPAPCDFRRACRSASVPPSAACTWARPRESSSSSNRRRGSPFGAAFRPDSFFSRPARGFPSFGRAFPKERP